MQFKPQDKQGILSVATEEGVAYVNQQDASARGVKLFIFNKRSNGKCRSQFIDDNIVHIVDLKQNLHKNILLYAVA